MPWIESHTVLLRHRKVIELAKDLRLKPVYVLGHLHALWHAALEQQEDGDLSSWSDDLIAETACYQGSAPEFVSLLQQHGWLDGKLLHDWLDYAGRFLIAKYHYTNRLKLKTIWIKYGRNYGKSSALRHKKGRGLQVRLGKVRSGNSPNSESSEVPTDSVLIAGVRYKWPSPEGFGALQLDPNIWADWLKARKEKGKAATPTSIHRAGMKLARWRAEGHDVNEIVERAAIGGWQGLFLVNGKQSPASKSDQQSDKIQAALRRGLE